MDALSDTAKSSKEFTSAAALLAAHIRDGTSPTEAIVLTAVVVLREYNDNRVQVLVGDGIVRARVYLGDDDSDASHYLQWEGPLALWNGYVGLLEDPAFTAKVEKSVRGN